MTHTITIYAQDGIYYGHHSDPSVLRLFGSCDIPTTYAASTPSWEVLSIMQRLNPDRTVSLA